MGDRSRQRALLALAALLYALLALGSLPTGADSLNYQLLTRSLFFDGDLFLANDLALTDRPIVVGAGGFPLALHNFGAVPFWLPFYALGHLSALLLRAFLGGGALLDGLNAPYVLWMRAADGFYGAAALLAMRQMLCRYLAPGTASRLVALLALGSPALYYMGALSPSSHAVTMALAALFVWLFLRLRAGEVAGWGWLALGLLAGALLWVANTNLPLWLLPAMALPTLRPWRRALAAALRFALGAVAAFSPQMMAWTLFLGSPFRTPYDGQLAWGAPHIAETLFSPYHGLFAYAPLLLGATVGLPLLARWDRPLALGALAALVLAIYLNAANVAWWAGHAFGARYLLALTPLFALGLAALWQGRGPRARLLLAAGAVGATLWTVALFVGYTLPGRSMGRYYSLPESVQIAVEGLLALPRWLAGRLLHPEPLLLIMLPLLLGVALLIEALARRVRLDGRRLSLALLVALPLLASLLWQRSHAALDRCHASRCEEGWRAGDYDPWDRAGSYFERARYHARRGEVEAALADRARMLAAFPDNPQGALWIELLDRDLAR